MFSKGWRHPTPSAVHVRYLGSPPVRLVGTTLYLEQEMRYPGHCEKMNFFLHELGMHRNREEAARILMEACPPVPQDVVYVHAAVEGQIGGELQREEFVGEYRPIEIDDVEWRAISWTTACSVAAVVEMVNEGTLPSQGFIKQEDIPLGPYLATANGSLYLS